MAAALVCAVTVAALSLSPDRSQYFTFEIFTVRCPSDSWSVYRNTSSDSSSCTHWGRLQGKGCLVSPTLHSDSGLYWCQDKDNHCTLPVNITVAEGPVILESPLFPVKEGQNVTLNCAYRTEEHHEPTSNFEAIFFKNNTFWGRFPSGRMVLSSVSKADSGMYKCEHSKSKEQSLESPLIVLSEEGPHLQTPPPSSPTPMEIDLYRLLVFICLFLLYTAILCLGLCIYCKWTRARAEEKKQKLERMSLRRIRNP